MSKNTASQERKIEKVKELPDFYQIRPIYQEKMMWDKLNEIITWINNHEQTH